MTRSGGTQASALPVLEKHSQPSIEYVYTLISRRIIFSLSLSLSLSLSSLSVFHPNSLARSMNPLVHRLCTGGMADKPDASVRVNMNVYIHIYVRIRTSYHTIGIIKYRVQHAKSAFQKEFRFSTYTNVKKTHFHYRIRPYQNRFDPSDHQVLDYAWALD